MPGGKDKGAIHVNMNFSGFKDFGLQILPLTLIFHFGETLEKGSDSGQSISISWQIRVIWLAIPLSSSQHIPVQGFVKRIQGFAGGANRIYRLDYKNLPTGAIGNRLQGLMKN